MINIPLSSLPSPAEKNLPGPCPWVTTPCWSFFCTTSAARGDKPTMSGDQKTAQFHLTTIKLTWDQAQFSFRFVITFRRVKAKRNVWEPLKLGLISGYYKIGHFRVLKTLTLKTRLSAKPLLHWTWVLLAWEKKTCICISMASHL